MLLLSGLVRGLSASSLFRSLNITPFVRLHTDEEMQGAVVCVAQALLPVRKYPSWGSKHRQECLCHTCVAHRAVTMLKHLYTRNLPHIQNLIGTYFVTFKAGRVFLPPPARSIALKHCLLENGKRIELHAGVIMPSHVHLLLLRWRMIEPSPTLLLRL